MKKHAKYAIITLVLLLASIPVVIAQTGGLRIDPAWPVMVGSPAEFEVWSQTSPSYDTVMDFVVSEDCYNGMADVGPVIEVTYDPGTGVETIISISKALFSAYTDNADKYPDFTNVDEGAKYTIASLKDHLSYGLSVPIGADDTIYIANAYLDHEDFDPLGLEPKEVTVTLDSTAPRMLIYMHGKSEGSENYDLKVPPTNPGFVVPEVATILLAGASFAGFGLYAIKRKRK
jgi:hypothetical protein